MDDDIAQRVQKLREVFPEKSDEELVEWLRNAIRYVTVHRYGPPVTVEPLGPPNPADGEPPEDTLAEAGRQLAESLLPKGTCERCGVELRYHPGLVACDRTPGE
jgi:hypothetical protein